MFWLLPPALWRWKRKKVRMHQQYLLSTLRNSVDTCEANTIIYDTERASTNIVTTTRSFTALPFPSICQPPISVFLRKKEMERLKTGDKKKITVEQGQVSNKKKRRDNKRDKVEGVTRQTLVSTWTSTPESPGSSRWARATALFSLSKSFYVLRFSMEGGNEAIVKLPDSKRIEGGRGALRTELASHRCWNRGRLDVTLDFGLRRPASVSVCIRAPPQNVNSSNISSSQSDKMWGSKRRMQLRKWTTALWKRASRQLARQMC